MTPLSNPQLLGLGLLGAGVLIWVVFALPSLIFPEERSPEFRPTVPQPVRTDDPALLYAKLSATLPPVRRPEAEFPGPSVSAFRAPPLETPSSSPRSEGSPGKPVSASEVFREVREERFQWMSQETDAVLRRAEADRRSEEERREKTRTRLLRRLERWRAAWRDRLAKREEGLRAESRRAEAARREVLDRCEQERERWARERAALADQRELLGRDREKEGLERKRREEALRAGEEEALRWEHRIRELTRDIETVEALRREEARSGREEMDRLRREAREEGRSWKERRKALESAETAERRSHEETLAALVSEGDRDLAALRSAHEEERERLARDKAELESRAREGAERSIRESREAQERLAVLHRDADALEGTLRETQAALKREQDAFAGEIQSIRSWSGERYRTLRLLAAKSEADSRETLAALRKERESRQAALAGEKDAARRDLEAFRAKAEEDRTGRSRLLEDARRAHENRLEAMRLEEKALEARIQSLGKETERLKNEAMKLEEKARVRLLKRRAVHEALYAETRRRKEAREVEGAAEASAVRTEIEALTRRLEIRKKRFSLLRERRRRALQEVSDRGQRVFQEALAALERMERQVGEGVRSTEGRAAEWTAYRERLAALPSTIQKETEAAAERQERESAGELSALVADMDQRWEDLKAATRRGRDALGGLRRRLDAADGDVSAEEVNVQAFLAAVRDQSLFLERLQKFFKGHLPPVKVEAAAEAVHS